MKKARTIRVSSVLLGALLYAAAAFPDASEQYHRTIPLDGAAPVTVENVNGAISIAAWDSAYADIRAEKRTTKDRRELEKVRIEVNTDRGLHVKTIEEGKEFSLHWFSMNWSHPHVTVEYTIKVPRSAALQSARTVNGNVVLRDTAGEASAYTTNGSIRAEGTMRIAEAKTVNGSIEVYGGATVREAHVTNGSITAALPGGNNPMYFSTVNGSIALSVQPGASLGVNLRTVNGKIVVPEGFTLNKGEVSKRHISGRLGSGGTTVDAKTVNGSITLDVK